MADIFSRFGKAVHLLGIFYLMLLVQDGTARDFVVGDTKGWSVPSDPNEYNQWAEKNRFQVGDSLVFNYQSGEDSVELVRSDNYNNCNTATSIQSYNDGHTVFKFNHSGAFHFVSGKKDKCLKNEKLLLVVLADRSSKSPNNQTSPPSPSPTGVTPAPAPTGQESPANEPPPPSGASTVFITFVGCVGALMATSYLFL